jgi:hypothetical protein
MTFERQIDTLYHHLRNEGKINRVTAFQLYGIADLRSRLSDVKREFGLEPFRQTVEGKKYLEYFTDENLLRKKTT